MLSINDEPFRLILGIPRVNGSKDVSLPQYLCPTASEIGRPDSEDHIVLCEEERMEICCLEVLTDSSQYLSLAGSSSQS